jgi:hypothetical protein
MPSAMLYKEWPDVVRVKREGRYWFIMRLVKYRGQMVDDVLQVDVRQERLEDTLRERGYVPMLGTDGWQKPAVEPAEEHPMKRQSRRTAHRPRRRRERSGLWPVV